MPESGWLTAFEQMMIMSPEEQELFEAAYEMDENPAFIYDPATQYTQRYCYQLYVEEDPLDWLENLDPADFISMTYMLNNDEGNISIQRRFCSKMKPGRF